MLGGCASLHFAIGLEGRAAPGNDDGYAEQFVAAHGGLRWPLLVASATRASSMPSWLSLCLTSTGRESCWLPLVILGLEWRVLA